MGKRTQKVHAADRKAKGQGNIKKPVMGLSKLFFYSEITRIEKDINYIAYRKLHLLVRTIEFGFCTFS